MSKACSLTRGVTLSRKGRASTSASFSLSLSLAALVGGSTPRRQQCGLALGIFGRDHKVGIQQHASQQVVPASAASAYKTSLVVALELELAKVLILFNDASDDMKAFHNVQVLFHNPTLNSHAVRFQVLFTEDAELP
jgi:hypothetical protein